MVYMMSKKKIHLCTLVYLTLFCSSFGQGVHITGSITDSDTNEPLAYATIQIFSLHTGTIADESGHFSLIADVDDPQTDTIEFSYLGYETKRICVNNFLISDHAVQLKRQTVLLEEVAVVPKEFVLKTLGIQDRKPGSIQYANVFGANKGNYLENPTKKVGWIKSVSYFLPDTGYPTCPFRVRIYRAGRSHTPEEDILHKNLIVNALKPGWFKVDVSEYGIPFPEEGVFIMMEWINSGEQYFFETDNTVRGENGEPKVITRKFYGQSLGTVAKKGGAVLWGSTLGNEWIPYDFSYQGKFPNAMINAEIAFEK